MSRVTLDYGTRPPEARRAIIAFSFAVTLIVAIVMSWRAWPSVERYVAERRFDAEVRAWYADALTWSQPPGTVKLWTTNPNASNGLPITKLSASPIEVGFFRDFRGARHWNPHEGPMLFMHGRDAGPGTERLVCVGAPRRGGPFLDVTLSLYGLVGGRIVRTDLAAARLDLSAFGAPDRLRIFAGQADPNDPARFTIPFEAHGNRRWIDGTFVPGTSASPDAAVAAAERDAGSRITLTVR